MRSIQINSETNNIMFIFVPGHIYVNDGIGMYGTHSLLSDSTHINQCWRRRFGCSECFGLSLMISDEEEEYDISLIFPSVLLD